jgi:hypothetical protein
LAVAFFAGARLAGAFLAAPSRPAPSSPRPSWPEPSSDHGHFLLLRVERRLERGARRELHRHEAAIFTGAPVCGLRPVRAARLVWLNEPKPGHDTLSFFVARGHVVEERTDRALGVRLGHAGRRRDRIDELCLGCH